MIDIEKFKELADRGDWTSHYAMLDEARGKAVSRDDVRSEIIWRIAALRRQRRFDEALALLKGNEQAFDSQSFVRHQAARILLQLGREQDALEEVRQAPFDTEPPAFHGLALDAKFCFSISARKRRMRPSRVVWTKYLTITRTSRQIFGFLANKTSSPN